MADPPSIHDHNHYGQLKVPVLNISLELLFLILYPSFLIPAAYLWFHYLRRTKQAALTPAGCRKLGRRGPSNTKDEFDTRYDGETNSVLEWKIKALFIYPVKSCAPVEMDELEIEGAGPVWDRQFVFAEYLKSTTAQPDSGNGDRPQGQWTFRTLRQPGYEKLAMVKPEVWVPDPSSWKDKSLTRRIERNGALVIKYPNRPSGPLRVLDEAMIRWGLLPSENSFQVPLLPPTDRKYAAEVLKIFDDSPTWFNYGEHIPDDFRQFIGAKHPLALFRVDPEAYRKVVRCAPEKEVLGYQAAVGGADDYAVNMLNLASIHDLGQKVKDSIPRLSCRRFRCNLLLTGPKAFDEDDWKRIHIHPARDDDGESGNARKVADFYCASRCTRCRLPNVDPDTGIRHASEPDKSLRAFRRIDEGSPNNGCLGMHLVPAVNRGTKVKVGDRVEVLEKGEHYFR